MTEEKQKGFLYQAKYALNTDFFECMTLMPDSETRYRETEFHALSDRDAVREAQKYVNVLEERDKPRAERNYFNPRAKLINLVRFSATPEGTVGKKEVIFKDFLTSARNINPPNYIAFFSVNMGEPLGILKRRCVFYEPNDTAAYRNAEAHLLLDSLTHLLSNITRLEQKDITKKLDEDKKLSVTLESLLRIEEV